MSLAITSPRPGSVFNSVMVAVLTLTGALGGFLSACRSAATNRSSATRHAKRISTAYDGFVVDARSPKPGKQEEGSKQPLPTSEELLGPGGVIARLPPAYEARPQQMEMATRVEAALRNKGLLTVEAATGTGKSLAYLAPLALHALRQDRPVIVSSSTHVLDRKSTRL